MSKVTITFEDEVGGEVKVTTDFDPPYETANEPTNAEQLACDVLEDIRRGESFMESLASPLT